MFFASTQLFAANLEFQPTTTIRTIVMDPHPQEEIWWPIVIETQATELRWLKEHVRNMSFSAIRKKIKKIRKMVTEELEDIEVMKDSREKPLEEKDQEWYDSLVEIGRESEQEASEINAELDVIEKVYLTTPLELAKLKENVGLLNFQELQKQVTKIADMAQNNNELANLYNPKEGMSFRKLKENYEVASCIKRKVVQVFSELIELCKLLEQINMSKMTDTRWSIDKMEQKSSEVSADLTLMMNELVV